MPVFQAPNPPLAPANVTGPTATSGVASTGNTGSSLSSARADHAHAATVDSLRTAPLAVAGTTATFDIALYDNLEWTLPAAPTLGEEANPRDLPGRFVYYVTLTSAYTSPNTNQRPSGKMIFKQPASGQITHQIRIATPAWATGGVEGLDTVEPFDATGKTLAQGGTAAPPYQCLTLIQPVAYPGSSSAFLGQIYEVEFRPLWDGTSWSLIVGAKQNSGGGGLTLKGGAPYVVDGGGTVVSTASGSRGLSIETAGDALFWANTTTNYLSAYTFSTFHATSDTFSYRSSRTAPTLNPTTPSTGIPTYFIPDANNSVWEWQLPNQASVGLSFGGFFERQYGYLLVRQPASGQVVNSITFYNLVYSTSTGGLIRGITTVSNPPNPLYPNIGDDALTTTLNNAAGTVLRDPMSPDLNPQRGFGAVTIYQYQYMSDGTNWYVLVRKLPGYSNTAVASATVGQALTVDSTGMPIWVSPRTLVRDGGVATPGTSATPGQTLVVDTTGTPTWATRCLALSTNLDCTTGAGTTFLTLALTVGTWFVEIDGWFWGSVTGTGIGTIASYTGQATMLVAIDVIATSGLANLTADISQTGTNFTMARTGTSGDTPLDQNGKRAFRSTVHIIANTAGTLTVKFSAATGTLTISRHTRARWDQL